MNIVQVARLFLHLREAKPNRGLRVEAVQKWAGGAAGDKWCVEMLWMWLDLATGGNAPFERGLTCEQLHQLALKRGWIVTTPEPGDVVLSVNSRGLAHHVALITGVAPLMPLTAIAGNTSANGKSDNGDRVAEHRISSAGKLFIRLPGIVA